MWLGVNDGNMEEGSLRCDANVSVRPVGQTTLGTKAEVKNVNSFRYLQKALEYEIERQIEVIESGGRVVQETRLWDSATGRDAFDAQQGRSARLPVLSRSPICRRSSSTTRASSAYAARCRSCPRRDAGGFVAQYAIPAYDAGVLTQSAALADYFEATAERVGQCRKPRATGSWARCCAR